jgi:hypothetical protein
MDEPPRESPSSAARDVSSGGSKTWIWALVLTLAFLCLCPGACVLFLTPGAVTGSFSSDEELDEATERDAPPPAPDPDAGPGAGEDGR